MKCKKLWMLLASGLLASANPLLRAQEEGIRLDFDFEQVNGTTVTDATAGIRATLANGAQIEKMGKYHVLDLGSNSGYLDMSEQTGNLFKSLDSYTVSVYYRVAEEASLSGAGFFLWPFPRPWPARRPKANIPPIASMPNVLPTPPAATPTKPA